MLRSHILSDIASLNSLHLSYPWIPDEYSIRPSKDVLLLKQQIMLHIQEQWQSVRDYILHMVFRQAIQFNQEGKLFAIDSKPSEWAFDPCMFPYSLIEGAKHFVLWNSKHDYLVDFDEEIVSCIIEKYLQERLGHDRFNFAWYKNPKPSVLEFYHVQVFWIENP